MKSEKRFPGLAYMFLGTALLISGPKVREQIDRMASDPDMQMAKAMYLGVMNKAVAGTKTEVAENLPPAPMQFDYAMTSTEAMKVTVPAMTIHVVAPAPVVELAELPEARKAELARMTARLEKANFVATSSFNRAAEMRRVVFVQEAAKEKCSKIELRTDL